MEINWWSFYTPVLCWCLLCTSNPATCLQNETDRLALISVRDAIKHDPFQAFISWNESLHVCNWYGVSCSRRHPDRVVGLNLKSKGLVGSLSPHIGNLTFLKHIELQNNTLYGQIPQEIGHLRRLQFLRLDNNSFQGNIPTNLSHCSNLMVLGLMFNDLVGTIPPQLGSLSKLHILALARNNLTGTIPPSIGNLSSLIFFFTLTNNLQGQIPQELSQLRSLTYLQLSENKFTGEIPSGLYNISSLEYFEVDFNELNGSIPTEIGLTLPKLISAIFAFNRFTGPIPVTLLNASMLQLQQVVFMSNNFTGFIPKDLGKLPHLQQIDFSSNQLEGDLSIISSLINCSNLQVFGAASNFLIGSIPISIANLSKQMQAIDLSNSQLQGTVPVGIQNLVNLHILNLENNNLTGPIHINFEKFQQLQYLSLYKNKLTGTLPSLCGNSTMLSNLLMGFNHFNGSIPPSLGNCYNLIDLDLSHNSLTGSIPKEVMRLSSLSLSLDLSANALSGLIPSEIQFLQNLVQLDLSDNRLSGVIPNAISKCLGLEKLYLEENFFEGEIPPDLRVLQGLQELDISRNNLSGKIPDSLAQLDGLNYLNLSFNQFGGEVPKRGIFVNASAVSLSGNNGLCGGITELKLPSCPFTNPTKKRQSFLLKVIVPVVFVAIVFVMLACFLMFRKKRVSKKNTISRPSIDKKFLRISYRELFNATNGFSEANIIGVGSYGSVYKGILEETRMEVAVKVLNLQRRGASNSFLSECQALRSIRHRNLLKLVSVCSSMDVEGNDFKALVYEFMASGSLQKWLHARDAGEDGQGREAGHLQLTHRLNIAIDIALAIEYLHNGTSSTIIHVDLKPSNVLLDDEMTAHIGDFGLAKIISTFSDENQQPHSSSVAIKGSIGYVAPEYGMGDMVSAEGDIYSYGILLLEMFTGKKPTDDSFKDDVNLNTFVASCLPDKVMDIVDPYITMFEDGGERFKECVLCVMQIGVACSMEQPAKRMKMRDVISELENIRGSCKKRRQNPERRNYY